MNSDAFEKETFCLRKYIIANCSFIGSFENVLEKCLIIELEVKRSHQFQGIKHYYSNSSLHLYLIHCTSYNPPVAVSGTHALYTTIYLHHRSILCYFEIKQQIPSLQSKVKLYKRTQVKKWIKKPILTRVMNVNKPQVFKKQNIGEGTINCNF